jgi:hypothetical protein
MQIGSFTGSFDWIEQPPARCDLTFSQLCDLMRLLLAGQPIPIYTDPADLLSDLHLVEGRSAMAVDTRPAITDLVTTARPTTAKGEIDV